MKRIFAIILAIAAASAALQAAPKGKVSVKVASYGLYNSFWRGTDAKAGKSSPQRMWCNCAEALAEQIETLQCDIIGIQDVCDSIAGRRRGCTSLLDILKARGGHYEWFVPSNKNPNYPLEGAMANGAGIIWNSDRFELVDWGVQWLGGIYDKPGRDRSLLYGGGTPDIAWVRLKEKASGKELFFSSAVVNGATQKDKGGKSVKYHEINTANCSNIISAMLEIVPKGIPSAITLNSSNSVASEGFKALTSARWFDVYGRLSDEGGLDEAEVKEINTMCSPDEKRLQGGRPDHILSDGFSIEGYRTVRAKFRTADGSLHYPSMHFPIVADLEF